MQDGHDNPLKELVFEVEIVLKPLFFWEQRGENGR